MLDADGAAAVEDLRAELARAKEQARISDAAALKAAEELEAENCSLPKQGGDGRNGHKIKSCYRPPGGS